MYCPKCGSLITNDGDLCDFCKYKKELEEAGVKIKKTDNIFGPPAKGSRRGGRGGRGGRADNKLSAGRLIFLFLIAIVVLIAVGKAVEMLGSMGN